MNNINDIKVKVLAEGIAGRYVHGESLSFGLVHLEKGSTVKIHHHIHEQITYMVEGEMEMEIGTEKVHLKAGNYFVIPSNVPHGAVALTECKVIDVFSPAREEYK
jgi:quercetin dioxygenase-like cupin family protein